MNPMVRFIATALVVLMGVGAAGSGGTLAHSGATGVVKERMDLMKGIGDAMKTLAAMFKGEAAYDADAVREAARIIESRAGEHITKLFPEGSLDEPSEALPTVWEDWAAFTRYADNLETYAGVLAAAAGNDLGPVHGGGVNRGPMMGGQGSGSMMVGQGPGPMMSDGWGSDHPMSDPEALKEMPPIGAFMRLSETCNACHTRFRVKK